MCYVNSSFSISIKTSWLVEDWVLDSVWVNDFEVAFLTAHNVLLLYQFFPSVAIISRISCSEQCILYPFSDKYFVKNGFDHIYNFFMHHATECFEIFFFCFLFQGPKL